MANDPKATCSNGRECCELGWDNIWRHITSYEELQPGSFDTWDRYIKRRVKFCPQTGERLLVVDGQPVVKAQVGIQWQKAAMVLATELTLSLPRDHLSLPRECRERQCGHSTSSDCWLFWSGAFGEDQRPNSHLAAERENAKEE